MPTFHKNITSHATRATVYQLRADVLCRESMESAFSQVIDLILPFVAKSLYAKLPPEAAEHHSFEISNEDRLCECVAVPERMLWAIRFKFTSKDETVWYYDVSLVREDDRLLFGMKIDTAFGADVKALQANLPLVESLLGSGLLAQNRPVTANLWPINTPEELTIDLRKKTIAYVASDSDDREHPAIRKCTAAEWDEIADLAASCRFDQWDESYVEPVLDGTSWKIDLLNGGKVVKESSGSNGYPNCWRMFTELKERCHVLIANMRAGL